MYRLLAMAKFNDRFVIPMAHAEVAGTMITQQGACGLEFAGGPGGCGPNGHAADAEDRVGGFHPDPPAPRPEPVARASAAPAGGCGGGDCTCGHGGDAVPEPAS